MIVNQIVTAIFACVVSAAQLSTPMPFPVIQKNQVFLDSFVPRHYANTNAATKLITMPDVWNGDDLNADFMSEMNRRATAHEFVRVALLTKYPNQVQPVGVLPYEANCYYPAGEDK